MSGLEQVAGTLSSEIEEQQQVTKIAIKESCASLQTTEIGQSCACLQTKNDESCASLPTNNSEESVAPLLYSNSEKSSASLYTSNIKTDIETPVNDLDVPTTPITTTTEHLVSSLPIAPIIKHIPAIGQQVAPLPTSELVFAAIKNAFEVEGNPTEARTTASEAVTFQSTFAEAANAIASAVALAAGKKTVSTATLKNTENGKRFLTSAVAHTIAQETVEAIKNAAAKLATDLPANVAVKAVASASMQPFASIALMREYDIDNTLNTIKENSVNLIEKDMNASSEVTTPPNATNGTASEIHQSVASAPQVSCDKEKYTQKDKNSKHTARKRWKILAHVLRNNSEESIHSSQESLEDHQLASVRRFKTFDLLRQDSFEDHTALNSLSKCDNWFKYHVALTEPSHQDYWVNIHHLERPITAICLMGFNNTGNVCIWPSEEALTVYVLSDLAAYRDKWILELGGGFTCLSGLMLSKYAQPYAVHLTDGNEMSVENVKKTLALNELSGYTKCSVLKWQDQTVRAANEREKFNYILSADCLFFDEARAALVDTIAYYLEPEAGVALIMAPRRGKTMGLFVDECIARGFRIETILRYNEIIWQRHLKLKENSDIYDEDLHYPVLLRLQKQNLSNCHPLTNSVHFNGNIDNESTDNAENEATGAMNNS